MIKIYMSRSFFQSFNLADYKGHSKSPSSISFAQTILPLFNQDADTRYIVINLRLSASEKKLCMAVFANRITFYPDVSKAPISSTLKILSILIRTFTPSFIFAIPRI